MEMLSSLLVGKPLNILGIAVVFLAGNFIPRFTRMGSKRHPRALLVVVAAWGLYAV